MDLLSKLSKWKKKSITKGELETLLGLHSDADLFPVVQKAVYLGILTPVNKKVTNGNYLYPIHMKYVKQLRSILTIIRRN
jgi:hypothetical protein